MEAEGNNDINNNHNYVQICDARDDRIGNGSVGNESLAVTSNEFSKCQIDSSLLHHSDNSYVPIYLEDRNMEEFPPIHTADITPREIPLPISELEPYKTVNGNQVKLDISLFKAAFNHRRHRNTIRRPCLQRDYQKRWFYEGNYSSDHDQYHLHPHTDLTYQTPIEYFPAPKIAKKLSDEDMTSEIKIPSYGTNFEIDPRFTHWSDHPMDDDDRASSLLMSVTSNTFFFLGGFFYSVVAAYVIYDEKHKIYSSYQKQQDLIDTNFNPWSPGKYYIMGVLGPLFFVLNAAVDIYRCTRWKNPKELDSNLGFDTETRWDVISATFFGIASTIDLLSSLMQGDDQGWQNDTYILSTHLYLLCAVATLIGLQFDASSTGDLLFAIGCMLFLIGTLIDTGLSYFISYGVESSQEIVLYQMSLVSAILWTVDALLYLMADFFFSEAPKKILTTANDMGIPCAAECMENNGADHRNSKTVMA